jgi:hypothetical protein
MLGRTGFNSARAAWHADHLNYLRTRATAIRLPGPLSKAHHVVTMLSPLNFRKAFLILVESSEE